MTSNWLAFECRWSAGSKKVNRNTCSNTIYNERYRRSSFRRFQNTHTFLAYLPFYVPLNFVMIDAEGIEMIYLDTRWVVVVCNSSPLFQVMIRVLLLHLSLMHVSNISTSFNTCERTLATGKAFRAMIATSSSGSTLDHGTKRHLWRGGV